MATISFSGGTIANVWANTPADRLNGTEPKVRVVGQTRRLLGTQELRVWEYASPSYTLTFTIRDIADDEQELCLALSLALQRGEEVTVETGDGALRTYPRCILAPGSEPPDVSPPDPQTMRREMTFTLLSLSGTPFVAIY